MRKTSNEKRNLITHPWIYPIASQHLAAIVIQKHIRGLLVRLRLLRGLVLNMKQPIWSKPNPILPYDKFIQSQDTKVANFYAFCAAKIQAWWRMLPIRRNYTWHRFPLYQIAALQIQYVWRATFITRDPQGPVELASKIIQRAWRSCADRKIYHYYRDLISFRNTGDPALLLKSINPSEASLLDAAAGAHVRFRLGGDAFPPIIYYKIFLHQAVCDLGAFSPKDYQQTRRRVVKAEPREKIMIRVGKRMVQANQTEQDTSSWYQRMDRNGWRPVTAKVISEATKDPVSIATCRKTIPFHYSKQKRRQDVRRAKLNKKREWMKKIYQEGILKERMEEIVDDDDDDDLLQWSEALDYEKYVDEWKWIGTSEAKI